MLQTVKVFLADTLTATACRSVSSLISLNRTDLLMYKVTPHIALSPGELFVIPEKPVRLIILSFRSWHSCTATIWGLYWLHNSLNSSKVALRPRTFHCIMSVITSGKMYFLTRMRTETSETPPLPCQHLLPRIRICYKSWEGHSGPLAAYFLHLSPWGCSSFLS